MLKGIRTQKKLIYKKILYNFALLSCIFYAADTNCSAYFTGIVSTGSAVEKTKSAVTVLATLVEGCGAIILTWGIGELILAYKDERPEEKTKGILKVMCGIILVLIEPVLVEMNLWTA